MNDITELERIIDGEEKDEEWFNDDIMMFDYEEEYQNPLVTHISSID